MSQGAEPDAYTDSKSWGVSEGLCSVEAGWLLIALYYHLSAAIATNVVILNPVDSSTAFGPPVSATGMEPVLRHNPSPHSRPGAAGAE